MRERRAANRRCRRNPEKSLKPSRGKTMDRKGAESPGSFRLSVRTYPTDTQPRHVDKHRPRMRTLGAPTRPHNQTQGCKTGTLERDSQAKPRTHKGTGRCWLPNPNPQKTHYREMHVFLQRPWRRRPTPTAPRQSLCLLKALTPAPPTLRLGVPEKLRGLGRTRTRPSRRPAHRMGR